MATTGSGSTHRHLDSRKQYTTTEAAHTHDIDLTGYATDAEYAALANRVTTIEAWIKAHPDAPVVPPVEPPVVPPVTPPVTPPTSTIYGSGLMGDSRANLQIGWSNRAKISYRFRSLGGSAVSVRVQERGGPVYSGGDGGTAKATIQKDNGSGQPDGNVLATVMWSPGNPKNPDGTIQAWEVWTLHTFNVPAALTAGGLYHLVFENIAADPVTNYFSLNGLFHFGNTPTPRTAAFSDDFAFMYNDKGSWVVQVAYVPIFDLAYADGKHDGSAYIGTLADRYGLISGANMVREKFTVTNGDRTVGKAHVRLKRISGTGNLVMSLEKGDGTVLSQQTVAASAIAVGAMPPGNLQGDTWAHASFPQTVGLVNGQTYALRLSTDATTTYTAVPIQEGTPKGLLSRRFTDGSPEKTSNGTTWVPLDSNWATDLQFWLD